MTSSEMDKKEQVAKNEGDINNQHQSSLFFETDKFPSSSY